MSSLTDLGSGDSALGLSRGKQMILAIKAYVKRMINWFWVAVGFVFYKFTRRTLPRSWQAIVLLFCQTGGRSNQILHRIISLAHPPKPLPNRNGVLGQLTEADVARIVREIEKKGYYVPDVRLPESVCEKILEFSLKTDYGYMNDALVDPVRFERGSPKAIKYQVLEDILINEPTIQKLISDFSFLSIAQEYLKCSPVANLIGLWWTTDFSKEPNPRAATMYHFDMSRIRWLNVFVNITDVTEETGPHTFVEGSHRPGGIPEEFLKRGYARIDDADVERFYGKEKIKEFTGPRGTIIIEDTRGLHKGKHVLRGDRLLFQISYADAMFGGEYRAGSLKYAADKNLEYLLKERPRMFAHYMGGAKS